MELLIAIFEWLKCHSAKWIYDWKIQRLVVICTFRNLVSYYTPILFLWYTQVPNNISTEM